jgi:hypothetical protein
LRRTAGPLHDRADRIGQDAAPIFAPELSERLVRLAPELRDPNCRIIITSVQRAISSGSPERMVDRTGLLIVERHDPRQLATDHDRPLVSAPVRRWLVPSALVLSVGALVGLSQAREPVREYRAGSAELTVIVPPIGPTSTVASEPSPTAPKPVIRRASAPALPLSPPRDHAAETREPGEPESPPGSSSAMIEDVSSRAQAIAKAARSGTLEKWSEGERTGFAAAGTPRLEGGRSCLEVLTWERGGSQGETVSETVCSGAVLNETAPKGENIP